MTTMTGPQQKAWDHWFDVQADLCDRLDEMLRDATADWPPIFRVALCSALVEWLAERMRHDIELPDAAVVDGRPAPVPPAVATVPRGPQGEVSDG